MKFKVPVTRDVREVVVKSDGDVEGAMGGEHMAYQILLVTDAGTWIIEGSHDGGPDVYDPKGKLVA
jgi:hypothetical protein